MMLAARSGVQSPLFKSIMIPPTKYYLIVIDNQVVAKRAIGPDENGLYPEPSADAVLVSFEVYLAAQIGWNFTPPDVLVPMQVYDTRPDTPRERIVRLTANVSKAKKLLETALTRLAAAKATITALQTDVTALKTFRTNATNRFNALEARVTALENK